MRIANWFPPLIEFLWSIKPVVVPHLENDGVVSFKDFLQALPNTVSMYLSFHHYEIMERNWYNWYNQSTQERFNKEVVQDFTHGIIVL